MRMLAGIIIEEKLIGLQIRFININPIHWTIQLVVNIKHYSDQTHSVQRKHGNFYWMNMQDCIPNLFRCLWIMIY